MGTRAAFILAALATVAVVFYEVENWRGERVWQDYRHQLEAHGEKLDIAAFTAPPVPDEKNFLKDPTVVKAVYRESGKPQTNWLAALQFAGQHHGRAMAPIVLGRIRLITNSVDPNIPEIGRFTGPDAFEDYLRKAFGFRAIRDPRGRTPIDEIYALPDTVKEISLRCQSLHDGIRRMDKLADRRFDFQGAKNGASEVRMLNYGSSAVSILEDCEPRKTELEALYHAAEQRPLAYADEDWTAFLGGQPHNFLDTYDATHFAAAHAKACLITGNPGEAQRDLSVMARFIEAERLTPFLGRAIDRLDKARIHVDVVGDGLREHLWREVDLAEIQKQLLEMKLLESLASGVRGSRVVRDSLWPQWSRTIWQLQPSGVGDYWATFHQFIEPHGWWFQDARIHDKRDQDAIEWLDGTITNGIAGNLDTLAAQLKLPNGPMGVFDGQELLIDSIRSGCETQILVNQAVLACGLERVRLSQSRYPEHLADIPRDLLPQNPRDLFTGQPMKYSKEATNYRLYSVGWNRADDKGADDDIVWKYSDATN